MCNRQHTNAALPTATLTGNGVRRPTPPTPPLTLVADAFLNEEVGKTVQFYARTDHDSTLVARGSEIEKTTKQLVAGEQSTIMAKLKHPNKIKARLKHPNRLNERPKVKLRVAATDEFGQTATDEVEVALCENVPPPPTRVLSLTSLDPERAGRPGRFRPGRPSFGMKRR